MVDISLAERFSYPPVIDEVISDFVSIAENVFGTLNLGVLLVGSVSRGELSWSKENDNICFYSDIEFIIVVDKKTALSMMNFAELVDLLDKKRELGHRFKIDFDVNTWDTIQKVDKKIFIFDSKNTGIDLGKKAVLPVLPIVTRENINFQELNDVLLHRMKSLLLDVPNVLFSDEKLVTDFALSIAKNTLDITTWLFPYEAEHLVSGFENRVEQWGNNRDHLVLFDFFDAADYEFLKECLEIRSAPLIVSDIRLTLGKCIRIYEKAIAYCKKMNHISKQYPLSDKKVSSKLFLEFVYRRRLKEGYLLIKSWRLFTIRNLVTNFFMPRKGRQIEFCYLMMQALSFYLNKQGEDYSDQLNEAKKQLKMIRRIEALELDTFEKTWLNLRSEYIVLNKVFI